MCWNKIFALVIVFQVLLLSVADQTDNDLNAEPRKIARADERKEISRADSNVLTSKEEDTQDVPSAQGKLVQDFKPRLSSRKAFLFLFLKLKGSFLSLSLSSEKFRFYLYLYLLFAAPCGKQISVVVEAIPVLRFIHTDHSCKLVFLQCSGFPTHVTSWKS